MVLRTIIHHHPRFGLLAVCWAGPKKHGNSQSRWWLSRPSERYARQIGFFPQVGVNCEHEKYLKPPPSQLFDPKRDSNPHKAQQVIKDTKITQISQNPSQAPFYYGLILMTTFWEFGSHIP